MNAALGPWLVARGYLKTGRKGEREAKGDETGCELFEMYCKDAKPVILSREVTRPAITSPRLGGVERMEYTIGFEGCGQRKTYVVICPEGGEGCFAADGRR